MRQPASRRGFFFTLSSIFLLFLLVLMLQPSPLKLTVARAQYYQDRVLLGQELVSTFRNAYIPSIIKGLAPAVFTGLAEQAYHQHEFYPSLLVLEGNVTEAYLTGRVNGKLLQDYLPGSDPVKNLTILLQAFANLSWEAYKINITISQQPEDYSFRLVQNETSGPWYFYILVTIPYNVTLPPDETGRPLATWQITDTIPVLIPVSGMPDPYLTITSEGWYNRTIHPYPLPAYWDAEGTAFRRFAKSKRYIPTNRSFSFLDRFIGMREHASCCGIMTIITPEEYAAWNQTDAHPTTVKDFFSCDPRSASMTSLNYTAWSFIDCEYFLPAFTPDSCRNPDDAIYAVDGWSNVTPYGSGSFPFTISASFAVDTFNLSTETTSTGSPSLLYLGEHLIGLCAYQTLEGVLPGCGNGIREYGEECDWGDANGQECEPPYEDSCTYCDTNCRLQTILGGFCGDNEVQEDYEDCDPPQPACTPGYDDTCTYCDETCHWKTLEGGRCGDGEVQSPPEQCDPPESACTPGYGESCTYCDGSCTLQTVQGGYCGDGTCQWSYEDCSWLGALLKGKEWCPTDCGTCW